MLIEYPFKTSQTQHESCRENYSALLEYYLSLKNCIEVRILSLISTDTPAVRKKTEMCAIKRRQKWNGQIKTLLLHEYCFHNNRHINSGVSKPRLLPVLNVLLLLCVKSLCGVRKVS